MSIGYYSNGDSYRVCDICGQRILGRNYGSLFGGEDYCCLECADKAKARKNPSSSSSSYEVVKEKPGFFSGLFGLIWKIVKWILIFLAVLFVYENYIKGDSTKEVETEHISSKTKTEDNGAVSNAVKEEAAVFQILKK